jgi:signal transduction histidine kinase
VSPDPPSNHLLELLGTDSREALAPVSVQVHSRQVLFEPGTPAMYVYFPVSAVISLVSRMEDGASTEVAVVGREGMVGLAGVLGTRVGTTAAVVQVGGNAFRVLTTVLRAQRLRLPSVRAVLDLYTQARLIQVAQTAACNRLHGVEARLARWLLAIADRVETDDFTVPQEFMAQMLGVHRPTVTLTLQGLRDSGVISYRGRSIRVADRAGLEAVACECYGVLRREFDRLLRSPIEARRDPADAIDHPAAGEGASDTALETMRQISGRLLLATIREQEARDEAEAANRAKDQFLAMVSHELRTPLNAILGWSDMLADGRDDPERGLEVIRRNAQALLKLVEELLDAARVTAGTLSIQPSPISLTEVLSSAMDAVRPAAALKGVALRMTFPDAFPPMIADPDRLRQVFLHVLANGLKFTDAGGAIELCAGSVGDSVRVSIRDTGNGIAPAELPYVFDRFRQGADASAGQHGLGLGLAIARVLVELHGGTIEVGSLGVGQGTTCTIDLPISARLAQESTSRSAGADM